MNRIIRKREPAISTADTTKLRDRVHELMKSISKEQTLAAKHAQIAEAQKAELLLGMRELGLLSVGHDGLEALRFTPAGRASTYIDPVKFRELVGSDEEFFEAIGVSVSKAKKILAPKALASISKITPGTPGKEQVVVKCAGEK